MDTNINNIITLPNSQQYDELLLAAKAIANGLEDVAENQTRPYHVGEWRTVQSIVRLGLAKNFFKIGDRLQCNHDKFGTLVWDIIGIDYDIPVNPETGEELMAIDVDGNEINRHSLTLQLHDCLNTKYKYVNSTWTDEGSWIASPLRDWLNTDEVVEGFSTEHGFIHGLDPDLLNILSFCSKGSIFYVSNTSLVKTIDKIFLPSLIEVNGVRISTNCDDGALVKSKDSVVDSNKSYYSLDESTNVLTKMTITNLSQSPKELGLYETRGSYPYYKQGIFSEDPSNDPDPIRIKKVNNIADYWFLRSQTPGSKAQTNVAFPTGGLGSKGRVDVLWGVSPCCVIA